MGKTRSKALEKSAVRWVSTGRKADGCVRDSVCIPIIGFCIAVQSRLEDNPSRDQQLSLLKRVASNMHEKGAIVMDRGYASKMMTAELNRLGLQSLGVLQESATSGVGFTVVSSSELRNLSEGIEESNEDEPSNLYRPMKLNSIERNVVLTDSDANFKIPYSPRFGDQTIVFIDESTRDGAKFLDASIFVSERASYQKKGKDQYTRLTASYKDVNEAASLQRQFVYVPRALKKEREYVFVTQAFRGKQGAGVSRWREVLQPYCRALTVTDSDPVWYGCRELLVTGTVAVMVFANFYEPGVSTNLDELVDTSFDGANVVEVAVKEELAQPSKSAQIGQVCVNQGKPSTGSVEEDDDDDDESSCDSDSASCGEENEVEEVIDLSTTQEENDQSFLFTKLLLHWSHPSFKPTRAMIKGKRNEGNVLDALTMAKSIICVGRVGLLQSKLAGLHFVAATPDAIAHVLADTGEECHTCVEIKTHYAKPELNVVQETIRKYPRFKYQHHRASLPMVKAGTPEFYDVVHHKHHRIQMITQAVVTGLRRVLYLVCSEHDIELAVIIDFPQSMCTDFANLLRRASPLLAPFNPIYTGENINDPCIGEKILRDVSDLHGERIGKELLAVVESRLAKSIALWRAFWKNPDFPLAPAKRIKPAVVMLYNSTKGAVDQWSKYAVRLFSVLSLRTLPDAWHCWRLLLVPLINSFIATRVISACWDGKSLRSNGGSITISSFRRFLKKDCEELVDSLASYAKSWLQPEPMNGLVTPQVRETTLTPEQAKELESQVLQLANRFALSDHNFSTPQDLRKIRALSAALEVPVEQRKREWFDTTVGRALRRSSNIVVHSIVYEAKCRKCIACYCPSERRRQTRQKCTVCGVRLCEYCFPVFHDQHLLESREWFLQLGETSSRSNSEEKRQRMMSIFQARIEESTRSDYRD